MREDLGIYTVYSIWEVNLCDNNKTRMESPIECVLKRGDEEYMTRCDIDQTGSIVKRVSTRSKVDECDNDKNTLNI